MFPSCRISFFKKNVVICSIHPYRYSERNTFNVQAQKVWRSEARFEAKLEVEYTTTLLLNAIHADMKWSSRRSAGEKLWSQLQEISGKLRGNAENDEISENTLFTIKFKLTTVQQSHLTNGHALEVESKQTIRKRTMRLSLTHQLSCSFIVFHTVFLN